MAAKKKKKTGRSKKAIRIRDPKGPGEPKPTPKKKRSIFAPIESRGQGSINKNARRQMDASGNTGRKKGRRKKR